MRLLVVLCRMLVEKNLCGFRLGMLSICKSLFLGRGGAVLVLAHGFDDTNRWI
jgi:hypothetical protein